jgi:hypothetical protein
VRGEQNRRPLTKCSLNFRKSQKEDERSEGQEVIFSVSDLKLFTCRGYFKVAHVPDGPCFIEGSTICEIIFSIFFVL